MTIVTYYTPRTGYEVDAGRLKSSVLSMGHKFKSYAVERQGDWVSNCSTKASVCLEAITSIGDDILWMDADCWLKRPVPMFFRDARFDVSCYVERPQYMGPEKKCHIHKKWAEENNGMWTTGILYLANQQCVIDMVHLWKTMCVSNPKEWDQVVLQKSWMAMDKKPIFRPTPRDFSCYGSFVGHDSGLRRHWSGITGS